MRWFEETIKTLLCLGVREFCVCAGKRNAPLVSLLDGIDGIQIYRHFEERSAAFFALGRTLDSGCPVAVVTTSGTAAGELLPAMMEATYVGAPLIALTADRPRSYRGSGAPQACEQKEIFGVYASVSIDCEEGEKLVLPKWDKKSPLHLNLCLEEPKILPSIRMRATEETFSVSHPPFQGESLLEFTRRVKKPLVIVSTLHPSERQGVEAFLRSFKAPVILEGVSGLRGLESLKPYVLKSTESVQPFDGVLKLGGVPTLRAWRDLEDLEGKIELLSISRTRYRGLSWGAHVTADLATLPHLSGEWDFAELKNQDCLLSAEIVELLQKYPTSEPGMVHALSKKMESDARVYLGNSLPIREWDLAACEEAPRAVWASRGLNGIDGQLSTALGLKADWALLGDLTLLYDLAGFWLADKKLRLVVINNGGGQIFKRVGLGDSFINPHRLKLKPIAELWGLPYARWDGGEIAPGITEVVPDAEATERFWSEKREITNRPARLSGASR